MPDDRSIADALDAWFVQHARPLPWRLTPRNPYWSLVSEFMLQQTQVSRVLEKFTPFIERFPSIEQLAGAPEDDVLAMWSGLGYYRRAKMLHRCAQAIVEHHAGIIPDDLESLQALPGIGRYTAGAMCSMVYNQRTPIVDGNVTRLLQRLGNNPDSQTDPKTVAWTWARAEEFVDCAHDPGVFNEAMMELGATICTPKNVGCQACPVRGYCGAFEAGTVEQIPPPKARAKQKTVYCTSVLVRNKDGHLLVEQRSSQGMWAGLFQTPTIENEHRHCTMEEVAPFIGCDADDLVEVESFTHITTHRVVQFVVLACSRTDLGAGQSRRYIAGSEIHTLGVSNAQKRIIQMTDTITA